MLSSRGPGSKSKRRLSPPGGPWLLERFVGKPSAVPSLSWVTFGPKRANAATVLGSGQYVQRPFPQLLFLCMPIHFSSLCESPFVHLEEAMLCCNSERFTLRLFSGQFYWPILSSGTLGTSSSSLQVRNQLSVSLSFHCSYINLQAHVPTLQLSRLTPSYVHFQM
ncbi:hypothetical protein MJT46_018802 [Ovis ammon polii x Ovis aries]|nr:hypothetical protein MJT46_018802 [Ovis ammon polii x Ovis aries]